MRRYNDDELRYYGHHRISACIHNEETGKEAQLRHRHNPIHLGQHRVQVSDLNSVKSTFAVNVSYFIFNEYQPSLTNPHDALHQGKRAANKDGRSA